MLYFLFLHTIKNTCFLNFLTSFVIYAHVKGKFKENIKVKNQYYKTKNKGKQTGKFGEYLSKYYSDYQVAGRPNSDKNVLLH